jgi:DedD protein
VGAFAKSASAEQMADQLRARGYPTLVVPTAEARDQRWRVRVGPLSSRNEANQMARRLQTQEQLPTWVLSEGGG